MMNRALFPLGKAYGKAFCNRVAETQLLVGNIQSGKHTLLIAPRRYGKSSLAEKAIQASGLPFARANFHLCTSDEEVASLIKSCVISLIQSSIGPLNVVVPWVKKFLKSLHPRVSFLKDIATLELISDAKENYAVSIAETLLMLEGLLKEKHKKAVLFLDEFQEIANISQSTAIEGAIRTAAQELQHLTIIFSGSIRSLLMGMFEDERRPLYKLCRKIHLERISKEDYTQHLQAIAQDTWGVGLTGEAVEKILSLSHCHPYFLNYLCDTLWQRFPSQSSVLPTSEDVADAWVQVLEEEWSDAVREISSLPMTQRRVMKSLAQSNASQMLSRDRVFELKLAQSSIASALNALLEKDYLEHREGERYEIVNPVLQAALARSEP